MKKPKKLTKYEKLCLGAWNNDKYYKLVDFLSKFTKLKLIHVLGEITFTIAPIEERHHEIIMRSYVQQDVRETFKLVKSIKPTRARS